MHLLWRITLALTAERVALVTVAMVTWLWLALQRGITTMLRSAWGLFMPYISMVTGQLQLLGDAVHVSI